MSAGDDLSGLGARPAARTGAAERADLVAYVDRRIGNARRIEIGSAADSDTRDTAADRRRQFEVLRDEIAQGMHAGAAAVAAQLDKGRAAAVAREISS